MRTLIRNLEQAIVEKPFNEVADVVVLREDLEGLAYFAQDSDIIWAWKQWSTQICMEWTPVSLYPNQTQRRNILLMFLKEAP